MTRNAKLTGLALMCFVAAVINVVIVAVEWPRLHFVNVVAAFVAVGVGIFAERVSRILR